MAYIEIKNYTKKIHNKTVLDNINLSFDKGRIYGITGKNGSGKTMLLKAVCGFITPTSGSTCVADIEVGNGVFPASLGVVVENSGFYDNMSAYDNLCLLHGASKNQNSKENIENWLKKFGLDAKSNRLYGDFSSGMQQRLCLVNVFMKLPELIVLDEPAATLDRDGLNQLNKILLEAKGNGSAIIIAGNFLEAFNGLCDEIYNMDNGKITLQK